MHGTGQFVFLGFLYLFTWHEWQRFWNDISQKFIIFYLKLLFLYFLFVLYAGNKNNFFKIKKYYFNTFPSEKHS
jgi:hypothetical protein